jgi:hypothetical protein
VDEVLDAAAGQEGGGTVRPRYYYKDGTPIEGPDACLVWARLFEGDYREVAKTRLWNGVFVSTVFLGLDHNWGEGPPLIFETMVFDSSRKYEPQERYSTEEQARAGHARFVRLYQFDVLAAVRRLWALRPAFIRGAR